MVSVNLVGICLIVFFLLFIFRKPNKQLSDYFLILTNLCLASLLGSDILVSDALTAGSFLFQTTAIFCLFPLLFTYELLLINVDQRIKKEWWWVYIFPAIAILYIFLDFGLHDYTLEEVKAFYEWPPLIYHFFYKGNMILIIGSLVWFLKKLDTVQESIKDQFSFIEPIRLNWLRAFSWVFIVIYAVTLIGFLIYNVGWIKEIEQIYLFQNITVVIALFYLCFMGTRQYTMTEFYESQQLLLHHNSQQEWSQPTIPTPPSLPSTEQKYQSSSLRDAEMNELYQQIIQLFESDHLYTAPQLQIQDLADRLAVTSHKISQTINSKAGKSFFDLINGYRVEHLKTLLLQPDKQQFTILALGLESGFNSKASLNRIFKRFTGMSPREYQKSQVLK